MSPTHIRRKGRLYRYYTSQQVLRARDTAVPSLRVPAGEIEQLVIGQLRRMITSPEVIVATWKHLRRSNPKTTESAIRTSLIEFAGVWEELFPAEQSRITKLLVDRVVVSATKVDVHLLIDGLSSLATELQGIQEKATAA